ncbi:MAG: hypothetical protein EHM25_00345 [Nitrosopumilales archaeon]|nr:MAG: hypothetical protein EHM25_00345 [Nitrosopumilales archaeon]
MDEKELKNLCDTIWKYLCVVFDREDVSGSDMASIVLTINARFFNTISAHISRDEIDNLKDSFINLIHEKLCECSKCEKKRNEKLRND